MVDTAIKIPACGIYIPSGGEKFLNKITNNQYCNYLARQTVGSAKEDKAGLGTEQSREGRSWAGDPSHRLSNGLENFGFRH